MYTLDDGQGTVVSNLGRTAVTSLLLSSLLKVGWQGDPDGVVDRVLAEAAATGTGELDAVGLLGACSLCVKCELGPVGVDGEQGQSAPCQTRVQLAAGPPTYTDKEG